VIKEQSECSLVTRALAQWSRSDTRVHARRNESKNELFAFRIAARIEEQSDVTLTSR